MKHWNQQRVCIHCSELFLPDRRNRYHQQFCNQPECRQASKAQSQKRWLKQNRDYFRGPQHVERVQAWRKAHPGYGQHSPTTAVSALPEGLPLDLAPHQRVAAKPPAQLQAPLQDVCLLNHPVFIGLISMFTGTALQEDIALTARKLEARGRDILGINLPEPVPANYDSKTSAPP